MLARIALSRGTKVALALLIVALAGVLMFSLLSSAGSGTATPSRSAGSGASRVPAGHAATGGGATAVPDEAPAETLRQRSLR